MKISIYDKKEGLGVIPVLFCEMLLLFLHGAGSGAFQVAPHLFYLG
jgi:hypothetical protein